MMNNQQKLVLIGGGHSHAIALQLFGIKPLPNVRITLISEAPDTPYSGMLPGHVAGFYTHAECFIDLRSLTKFARAEFICDRAINLDLKNNQVICANSQPVSFDLLSIDIGSTPATISVPGANEYAIAVKPIPKFLQQWNRVIESVTNQPEQPICLGIVGGGAGGVELSLTMQSHLQKISQNAVEIHLFHRDRELMPNHNRWVRRHMQELLIRRGIHLHLAENVCEVQQKFVKCESGLIVEFDYLFWVTQASAPDWPKISGLATNGNNFILVNDNLQSVSHSDIFAAGDIATLINNPCPKAGVFAVRQGKPLFNNLRLKLEGKSLKPYQPQKRYLSLIGTGDGSAVASWGQFGWESPLLWYLKDWIDRRFMNKFNSLSSDF
ncbi:FAD-dependent oxidoreductase [Aerosakkonema sp. BLCC-F183]|uniref:FAD-dependent oxidoreductase n=1 Tax=Aerosakkonema sp. BLCC-F183 TaxID=3342834 RepID=UPI0035B9D3CB